MKLRLNENFSSKFSGNQIGSNYNKKSLQTEFKVLQNKCPKKYANYYGFKLK